MHDSHDKYCSRCKKKFECRADEITLCHCSKVELNNSEREFINSKYADCLCAECIQEVKGLVGK